MRKNFIDLGSQNEVVFGEAADCVGKEIKLDFVVKNVDVRMVTFLLGNVSNTINKRHRLFKIFKLELPPNPMRCRLS